MPVHGRRGVVLISDSAVDDEYADSPLFSVSGVRSSASVPSNSAGGHVVGTLCVMDERPGTRAEDTVQVLHSQRAQALVLLARAGRLCHKRRFFRCY